MDSDADIDRYNADVERWNSALDAEQDAEPLSNRVRRLEIALVAAYLLLAFVALYR